MNQLTVNLDLFFQSLIAWLIRPGVIGMDIGDVNLPAYQTRGKAALELYKETALLFNDIITEKHREVMENTLELISQRVSS